jgi:hypothetical protein
MYVYFRLDASFNVMSVRSCCYGIINSLEKNYITKTSFSSFSYAVSDVDAGNRMTHDV